MKARRAWGLWLSFLLLLCASEGFAQGEVADERVSLLEGPGSLEGVGENVTIDTQMGLMSYSVSVELPEGFPDMTPRVGLSYTSGGGASIIGMGWNLAVPNIERMTSRGLPEYHDGDLFAAGGGAQLVRVSEGEPAIYRARNEGGFVRYKWVERGDGGEGYWIGEAPGGQVSYYGADSEGTLVDTARIGGSEGTFRYRLVEKVDRWGHRIRYEYRRFGTTSLVSRIAYVFDGRDEPRFSVLFDYEDRPDHVSDAKGGFIEVLEQRLAGVRVMSGTSQIGRWALTYEDEDDSGGLSRLARVERFGADGGRHPVVFDFGYSRSLGALCDGINCDRPYLVSMGNLGVNFQGGNTTLIDINGDALPDVLNTPNEGAHRIFLNGFRGPRDHAFEAPHLSEVGTASTHLLRAGSVTPLDVDGDGFADLVNTRTGQVLENKAVGDWTRLTTLFEDSDVPDLDGDLDPEDGDLSSIRFFDYDNDKKIDVIRSEGAGAQNITQIFRNTGGGFAAVEVEDRLGLGFDSDRLQLADMNGDGLMDAVQLQPGRISYRINLGRGRWMDWFAIEGLPIDESNIPFAELEDLNNDGLSDIVVVRSSTILYALNRNGQSFDAPIIIETEDVDGDLPQRLQETTILYADMNGNGSEDIVWIDPVGEVAYLELFAVQPNLLSRITNGLGQVNEISYGTSVEQAARDALAGSPWTFMLPFATTLVTKLDVYDTLSDVHQITDYRYRDGFYDGVEKQFRGYARVETESPGDDSNAPARSRLEYDVGAEDPYRAGLLLRQSFSNDGEALREVTFTHEDCPLAGVPQQGLEFPIRYVCQTHAQTVLMEGAVPSEWVTTEVEQVYDGYGNVALDIHRGVTAIGGEPCEPCQRDPGVYGAPCGPQCLGDESFIERTYVDPEENGDLWITGAVMREARYGREGSEAFSEKRVFYDGPDFEGLPFGQLTRGFESRVEVLVNNEGDHVQTLRARTDEHGNMLERILPQGDADIEDDHRLRQTYDALGLRVVDMDVLMTDADGAAYSLHQRAIYEPRWLNVETASDWIVVRDGAELSPENTETAIYDEFGRLKEKYHPGDPQGAPSERLTYDLGNPVSRVITELRTLRGGDFDQRSVRCFDGFGRLYQERTLIEGQSYLVGGYKVFNHDGKTRRAYDKFIADGDGCDVAPPSGGVAFQDLTYDAAGRVLTDVWVSDFERWVRRNDYGPSYTLNFDYNDTDPESVGFETPTRHEFDGLGRNTAMIRMRSTSEVDAWTFTYDELGNVRGYIGPEGHEKRQIYDRAGRLVRIEDPNRGVTTYEHDAAGQVLREVDGRGVSIAMTHDAMGRLRTSLDEADPEATLVEYHYDIPRTCPDGLCTFVAGRLAEMDFPLEDEARGVDWFGFNSGGKATYQGRSIFGRRFDFAWEYDNTDRMTSRIYPDGRRIELVADGASRIQRIEGVLDEVVYDETSRVSQMRMANGTTESLVYDAIFRVAEREVTTTGGEVVYGYRYNYDRGGNLLALLDSNVAADKPSATAVFTYDALDRLTDAHLDPGREGFEERMAYGYDRIGNLTTKTSDLEGESVDHVGNYAYGEGGAGPNAVTRAGGVAFEYDAAGQMIRHGEMELGWDARGRLASVHRDGREAARNIYNAGSKRLIQETEDGAIWYLAGDYEIRAGVASIYVDAGDRDLARLDSLAMATVVLSDVAPVDGPSGEVSSAPDGVIDAADAWVAHAALGGHFELERDDTPDASGALLEAAVHRLLIEDEAPVFLHSDHRKTTIATTSGSGEVLERSVYYPHGQVRGEIAEQEVRGYNGKEKDEATGFVAFDARYLDPWLGRWISPDPLFIQTEKAVLSRVEEETGAYASMANNPVRYHDPDGRFVVETIELVVRGIGAVAGAVSAGTDWFQNTKREAQIMGKEASTASLVGNTALGTVLGAGYGFVNPGVSALENVLDLGISSALDKGVLSRVFKGQNLLTARRVTRSITTAGVSVGLILGVAALAATPAAPLAIIGAVALAAVKIGFHIHRHRKAKAKAIDKATLASLDSGRGGKGSKGSVGRSSIEVGEGVSRGGVQGAIASEGKKGKGIRKFRRRNSRGKGNKGKGNGNKGSGR